MTCLFFPRTCLYLLLFLTFHFDSLRANGVLTIDVSILNARTTTTTRNDIRMIYILLYSRLLLDSGCNLTFIYYFLFYP